MYMCVECLRVVHNVSSIMCAVCIVCAVGSVLCRSCRYTCVWHVFVLCSECVCLVCGLLNLWDWLGSSNFGAIAELVCRVL
jgi:hypothetical protein